jgi:chromosome segregation ATPase
MTIKEWFEDFKIANEATKSAIIELIDRFHSIADDQRYIQFSLNLSSIERFLIEILNDLVKEKETINVAALKFMEKRLPTIDDMTNQFLDNPNESTKQRFEVYTQQLEEEYIKLKKVLENEKANNSEEYYNKNINELQSRIEELQKNLSTENENNEKSNNLIKDLISQKEKYERELALKKKQLDVKEDWKNKIEDTFNVLKTYLQPIKKEQSRLNRLFWAYLILSSLLVVAVVIIEYIAVNKVYYSPAFPDFKQYITLFLPIPIVGAMLWAFIYQMNRAQRQLIVIAKSIHKVEYVQGLLLAINKLAP